MERIDENGERRKVDPGEVARLDQVQAEFEDLTQSLLRMRAAIEGAALKHDNEGAAALTKELGELCREKLPTTSSYEISFIMFLLHLIEEARDWTERTFAASNLIVRLAGGMSGHSHPIRRLPGFDQATLDEELDACQKALIGLDEGNTFTTDTGITLHNVHPEGSCEGGFCVVHKPAPGPWATWDTHWRDDWKLMVRRCPHDVDHVAMEELLRVPILGAIGHEHPAGCDCACDFSRCETITDSEGNILGFRANG